MNVIGSIISGSITLLIFIAEFYFGFTDEQKYRKIVKPFCLIGVIVTVAFMGARNPLLFAALGCGLLGDILLIWNKSKRMFLLGTISFFANHVLYIILFASLLTYQVKPWIIVALCVLGTLFPLISYRVMYQYVKKLSIPGGIYFFSLFVECLFAALLVFDLKSPYAIMLLVGNIIFIISDVTLTLTNFVIEIRRKDFYIMLTYLIAQSLISVGLCFLL